MRGSQGSFSPPWDLVAGISDEDWESGELARKVRVVLFMDTLARKHEIDLLVAAGVGGGVIAERQRMLDRVEALRLEFNATE